MKSYEIRNEMERKIRWLGHKKSVIDNFLNNGIRDLANMKELHRLLEEAGEKEVARLQVDWDMLEGKLQVARAELEAFNAPKTVDLPRAAEESNGKLMCDICGKKYSAQGYAKHRASCEQRQEKLKELARLEELKKELEEENGGA